jgi:4a-hydroxytetrahydrobiopterin dehydratase
MSALSNRKFEKCKEEDSPMSSQECKELMKQLPDWAMIQVDDMDRLTRTFEFADFLEAMAFTQKAADLAEAEGHHPALLTEWGKVTVSWWTHLIGGLHINDFIMAAKTDRLF